MTAPNNRRDAELAGYDGGMARPAAAVGHHRGAPLHHRLPVRVCHVRNQHITVLDLVHVAGVANDADRPGANLLPDGPAAGQLLGKGRPTKPRGLELVLDLLRDAGLRLHRLGPRLQDVQLAVNAVLAPFNVHRSTVVLFNDDGVPRELHHLGVAQRKDVLQRRRHRLCHQRLARRLVAGEPHFDQLGAQVATHHSQLAGRQRRLVHEKLVRVDGALHDRFADAVR
mmetsp:Transcript_16912/g.44003  ORF Transcript_16912/g.44003 Transcript_16912/m.44003 type:complete len:226 (-) Transcript_16912:738-1415(-)